MEVFTQNIFTNINIKFRPQSEVWNQFAVWCLLDQMEFYPCSTITYSSLRKLASSGGSLPKSLESGKGTFPSEIGQIYASHKA